MRRDHGSEAEVMAALAEASIYDLARAFDESAFVGDKSPDRFACPDCGSWLAEIIDSWRWACPCWPSTTTTGAQRTKLALRQHVAARFDACRRLVDARRRAGRLSA